MNNFVVSARKYRPSTFKTVVGQDYIVTTLKNAIKNNQLAQAFLFTGPRGVGKTTCARILAKTINCTSTTEDFEACNECVSCKSFNESASFNVHELDAASNNSVDDIRTLVDQVRIPPQAGLYKIYIIDEVHMLSTAAFNAFLKTLEEPPSYAKFILATTEKHKIIPTILSRCQVFDFKRIRVDDIARHLAFVAKSEQVEAEPQALHIIATKSDGALRDALSMFDQLVSYGSNKLTSKDVIENLNILDYEYHFRLISSVLANDTTEILLILEEIYEKGFDGQAVITGITEHVRALLVCKDEKTLPLLEVHENLADDYLRQSRSCSIRFLIKALDIMTACDVTYKSATSKRFHIELSILKLTGITDSQLSENPTPESKPSGSPQQNNPVKPVTPTITQQPTTAPQNTVSDAQNTQSQTTASEQAATFQPAEATPTKTTAIIDLDDMSVMDVIRQKSEQLPSAAELDKPFTDEDINREYLQFQSKLKVEEKGYELSILSSARFEKKDNESWMLVLGSNAECEAFRKVDLQSYLREQLSNKAIKILFEIEQRGESITHMTREERSRDFISHNPEVQLLIRELDAHPDL
jgi:DNA polymerase III subunit gamma/tau